MRRNIRVGTEVQRAHASAFGWYKILTLTEVNPNGRSFLFPIFGCFWKLKGAKFIRVILAITCTTINRAIHAAKSLEIYTLPARKMRARMLHDELKTYQE